MDTGVAIFCLLVVARWIHFACVFLLFGSALFVVGFARRAPEAARAAWPLARASALAAGLTAPLWLALILANMTGSLADAIDGRSWSAFLFATPFGPAALGRLTLSGLAAALALFSARSRFLSAALAALGGLLLIDQAWFGHAADGGPATMAIYAMHVLAAAGWVGSLAALALALAAARCSGSSRADMAALMAAYSRPALLAVAAIAGSGALMAAHGLHENWRDLYLAPYGQIVLVKTGLFAAMLVCALRNRFIFAARLDAVAEADGTLAARLRASVTLEFALGLAVLAAAALLGVAMPIR